MQVSSETIAFEEKIYRQLARWRDERGWHFSLRKQAGESTSARFFIGSLKRRYFGTTFWEMPGSVSHANDTLNIFFNIPKRGEYTYTIESRQSRKASGPLTPAYLDLVEWLATGPHPFTERATLDNSKQDVATAIAQGRQRGYEDFDLYMRDVEQDLSLLIELTDEKLKDLKQAYPDLTARRLTQSDTVEYEKRQREIAAKREKREAPTMSKAESTPAQRSPVEPPLNLVLYGPPGTGKTYSTINRAIEIVNPGFKSKPNQTSADLQTEYRRLLTEGKIVFTTFHQSLSYEDFVEGLKPELDKKEGKSGEISYEITPGIFRELIDTVLTANEAVTDSRTRQGLLIDKSIVESALPYKISLGDSTDTDDNGIYDYCIANDCIALGYGEEVDFTQANNEKEILSAIRNQRGEEPSSRYEVTAVKTFRELMKKGDLVFIPNGLFTIRAVGIITSDYYLDREAPIRFSQFRKVEWLYRDIAFPIKEVYGKQFSVQTIYGMALVPLREGLLRQHENRSVTNNHVLIIDEINRGNVSAILGELITLLEPNKRLGEKEELTVTLPYSRNTFGVPPNLYIIGTMNTADRSVEALDAALRRRFVFQEVAPDPAVITRVAVNGGKVAVGERTVDLAELLRILNERIVALRDSDHQLGHSYFLEIADWRDLSTALADRIVPLLREYFFADNGQLQLVVGEGFCAARPKSKVKFATVTGGADTDLDGGYLYSFPRPSSAAELVTFLDKLGYPWQTPS